MIYTINQEYFTPSKLVNPAGSQYHEEIGYASFAIASLSIKYENRGIQLVGSERIPRKARNTEIWDNKLSHYRGLD